MKKIVWNNVNMTTIAAVAEYYAPDDKEIQKEIKPFIRQGLKKLNTVKLTKDETELNKHLLTEILPNKIPHNGILLLPADDVKKIESYFMLVLRKKSTGDYKKDRFKTKRSLIDEVKFELKNKKININDDEFKAVLSLANRLEKGQWKIKAYREASKKFGITQVRLKEIMLDLDLQIDYKNKPKDYV